MLDAAERLFVRSGPSSVSLRDIAREAHVNLGLIHRHIGAKDDLVRAVFRRFMQQGLERMQGVDDWAEVVELVFTPTRDLVNYTRLLGWLLLEGADPAVLAEHGSPLPVVVQRAAAETGDHDQAQTLVVGLLSMAYGWQVFEPYFRQALGSGEELTALPANLAALGAALVDKGRTP